jgi:large subunit ribosomal protein L15
MPLTRRLPKRGFRNPSRREFQIVSVADLARFPAGSVVDPQRLRQERLVRRRGPVKLLSDGEVSQPLTVRVHAASAKAREKVQAAGGTVEVIRE